MIRLFEVIYKGKNGETKIFILSGDNSDKATNDNHGLLFGTCIADKIISIKEIAQ